ncbi:MAG: hypothetical protein KGD59_07105 [Candidatus Heimdallarchaeota archaeon]|nr:hypothetical protein [Candidatus Heimdallarchaeota archaeon]
MISTTDLAEKIFTIRDPNYSKRTSPKISASEKAINKALKRKDIETTANPDSEGDFLVLLIHGFATSKYCWLDPDIGNMGWVKEYQKDPEPVDYGWHSIPPPPFIPVEWTLSEQLVPKGVTEILDQHNIDWLTYSQKSPFGDIEISVKELKEILNAIKNEFGKRRIIIIAHSRGGLISKRYLDTTEQTPVEKLVTFGTPYGGTFFSAMEMFRLPSKQFLNRVKAARRLWDVSQERKIDSISTKQMAPRSDFLIELSSKGCREDIKYVNVAGRNSLITNVYTWRWETSCLLPKFMQAKEKMDLRKKLIAENSSIHEWYDLPSHYLLNPFNWILIPNKIFEFYPRIGYPEVLRGDGAVSVESALMDDDNVKQYIINKNHVDMTCCQTGYDIMIREIKETMNTD